MLVNMPHTHIYVRIYIYPHFMDEENNGQRV